MKLEKYIALKNKYGHAKEIDTHKLYASGAVYTPDEPANHLAKMAILQYLRINKPNFVPSFEAFFENNVVDENAHSLFNLLKSLKILDLSSGSGMLVLTYVELMIRFSNAIHLNSHAFIKDMLENKIVVFDISEDAINKYKELCLALGEAYGLRDEIQFKAVYCQNSLISDLSPYNNTFDLILGNPPYIGEKGNTKIFNVLKESNFGSKWYEGKMDYFYFFIYKGYDLLKSNGVLCYLTSNYFFTADGAKKLRNFIFETFYLSSLLNYGAQSVFGDYKLHAAIYTLQKDKCNTVYLYNKNCNCVSEVSHETVFDKELNMHFISDPMIYKILSKMEAQSIGTLEAYYDVFQGIVSGLDRKDGEGVFVYKDKEVDRLPESVKPFLKPFYKNSAICHYHHKGTTPYSILYITKNRAPKEIESLLFPYKALLENRREVKNGVRKWYELTWPRQENVFLGPKIIVPQRAKANYFAFDSGDFFASADIYFIKDTLFSIYSLEVLTMVLNARLYKLWLTYKGKRKGDLLELYATPLKKIPLPNLSDKQKNLLNAHFSGSEQSVLPIVDVDKIIYEAYGFTPEEIKYMDTLD